MTSTGRNIENRRRRGSQTKPEADGEISSLFTQHHAQWKSPQQSMRANCSTGACLDARIAFEMAEGSTKALEFDCLTKAGPSV